MSRSTEHLYDENYYRKKYSTWVSDLSENNSTIKRETEKKYNFIKQYMSDAKSILIPGCSFGFLVMMFRNNKLDAYGIDVAPFPLEHAPDIVRPYLQKMNIKKMEFSDNYFDIVAPFDIVEHLYYEEILEAMKEINRVAEKYILLRLPIPYYDTEIGISDFSNHPSKHHTGHVSIYPWDFWARRVTELGKFQFWFASIWGRATESSCEAWISFRRN